ncbi:unnamed protein product [Linum trigynum]|uniref:Uncharacterized protein n=1 Tax=Linum trigynum TaxID=586398 RepID=A0AAV2E6H1_9ROSI
MAEGPLPLDMSEGDTLLSLEAVEMLIESSHAGALLSLVGCVLLLELKLVIYELLVLEAQLLKLKAHLVELVGEEIHPWNRRTGGGHTSLGSPSWREIHSRGKLGLHLNIIIVLVASSPSSSDSSFSPAPAPAIGCMERPSTHYRPSAKDKRSALKRKFLLSGWDPN